MTEEQRRLLQDLFSCCASPLHWDVTVDEVSRELVAIVKDFREVYSDVSEEQVKKWIGEVFPEYAAVWTALGNGAELLVRTL